MIFIYSLIKVFSTDRSYKRKLWFISMLQMSEYVFKKSQTVAKSVHWEKSAW